MSSALPPMKDDGLPTLPTGEPVLQRWFVLAMLLLVPVAIAVTVWAFASIPREQLSAAERRPPGDGQVTIERGAAVLAETRDAAPGPDCGQGIRLIGDSGSRAAAARALQTVCALIATGEFPVAREGLVEWIRADGILRIATFELAGVESSARVEDDRIVVELNAKFQFDDAARAAPALVHQLALIADANWPGAPITAERELQAARLQAAACAALDFADDGPRGCLDVTELLRAVDPLGELRAAGYPSAP
jgi:hypothetical protein